MSVFIRLAQLPSAIFEHFVLIRQSSFKDILMSQNNFITLFYSILFNDLFFIYLTVEDLSPKTKIFSQIKQNEPLNFSDAFV
jgi:hypothetical protein